MFPNLVPCSDVFSDNSRVLEGEQLDKGSSIRGKLWCDEQPVVFHDTDPRSRLNHSCLQPILTTPSANPPLEGTFEDWTVLSRPESHSINIHSYGSQRSPGSASSLVCFHAPS